MRGVSGELLVGASFGELLIVSAILLLLMLSSRNSFPDTSFTSIVPVLHEVVNGEPS